MEKRAIVWLRRDLRLNDHRPLFEATHSSEEVLPVFIIDENILKGVKKDNRQVSFIQNCIDELHAELEKKGSQLFVLLGKPIEVLPAFAKKVGAGAVYFGRDYEGSAKARDEKMLEALSKVGAKSYSLKDQVIFEGREILNGSGEPYKVFTPYSNNWKKQLGADQAAHLREYPPQSKRYIRAGVIKHSNPRFSDLGYEELETSIPAGEKAAAKLLKKFRKHLDEYKNQRDFPALDGTSKLSPHFRFGTLSIREAVRFCIENSSVGARTWLSELIWREFYQMVLDQFPHVEEGAFKKHYQKLAWSDDSKNFKEWCEGKTGYPLVDAAMRQLNETGWMHNRLRMVTAMFLTKDLLVNWQLGERYFAEKLLDYDLSANNGGWQWSASTGCDSQPYFRVMNPISQSERFDPKGEFIRKYVPELAKCTDKQVHWPHDDKKLSPSVRYYPPIVDHAVQRVKAISMFKKAK